jgi:hypothetical protein
MELEIVSGENSSKQSTKYPSTMKHMQQRLIHVEHSYLKLKEFSFVFACFFSTNKYISIELVQWNTLSNERPKQVQQKKAKNEKKETRNDRKRHKNEFSCFLSPNTNTNVTHAHTDTRIEWCMKNIYLGKE